MNELSDIAARGSLTVDWGTTYGLREAQQGPLPFSDVVRPWMAKVVQRLRELSNVSDEGDGTDRPLNPRDIVDALMFLSVVMARHEQLAVPWIGCLSNGGVQLTWHKPDVEVEAVFDRERKEQIVLFQIGDLEIDVSVEDCAPLFAKVADRLADDAGVIGPRPRFSLLPSVEPGSSSLSLAATAPSAVAESYAATFGPEIVATGLPPLMSIERSFAY